MNEKTFLKWVGIEINQQNKKQLLIPTGFAHESWSDISIKLPSKKKIIREVC